MNVSTYPETLRRIIPALVIVFSLLLLVAGCGERTAAPGTQEGEATVEKRTPQTSNVTPPTMNVSTPKGSALSRHDRQLLEEAMARGDKEVLLLIATEPGRSGPLVGEITSLGGDIRSHHEDLGYIGARVPVDKVEAVAQLEGVQTVSLEEELTIPDPRP